MAEAELKFGELGGGGSRFAISDEKSVSANAHPSWNSTPFKAKSIFMHVGYSYGGSYGGWFITNVNPTTGEIDNSTCWTSYDGGATWAQEQVSWTVTDSYIEYNNKLSSVTTTHSTFVITDNGEFEFE